MNKNVKYVALTYGEIYHKIWQESQTGAYVSYLRGKNCKTEDDFLREVAASFQFPYYYGENWAAFDEWKRLDDNSRLYSPKSPAEELHPLFVESLQKLTHQEYILDCLNERRKQYA